MVRRAKLPRDRNNRIVGPFNHRELSGWPDGINGAPALKRKRKRKQKSKAAIETITHTAKKILIGTPL